jgi:phenylacetate-CoA ligase
MAKITGRSDDMLIVRGVNLFPTQIEEQILRCADLAPHYLIEVTRPERLDELCVQVERKPDSAPEGARNAAAELRAHIKNVIGVSVTVQLCEPGSIGRSAGKASRVHDRRPK